MRKQRKSAAPRVDFKLWKCRLETLAKQWYGLEPNDFDEDFLRQAHGEGDSPEDYLEYHGRKYDLDRIDRGPYGH